MSVLERRYVMQGQVRLSSGTREGLVQTLGERENVSEVQTE